MYERGKAWDNAKLSILSVVLIRLSNKRNVFIVLGGCIGEVLGTVTSGWSIFIWKFENRTCRCLFTCCSSWSSECMSIVLKWAVFNLSRRTIWNLKTIFGGMSQKSVFFSANSRFSPLTALDVGKQGKRTIWNFKKHLFAKGNALLCNANKEMCKI